MNSLVGSVSWIFPAASDAMFLIVAKQVQHEVCNNTYCVYNYHKSGTTILYMDNFLTICTGSLILLIYLLVSCQVLINTFCSSLKCLECSLSLCSLYLLIGSQNIQISLARKIVMLPPRYIVGNKGEERRCREVFNFRSLIKLELKGSLLFWLV